ncbi:MAG: hypothetical protein JSS00_14655 [Proteobacteria bacterium]|nr:hypothetical protein [Pseudomonadota bacterium]
MNAPKRSPNMQKITVEVDADVLEAARQEGASVTDTVRQALRRQAHVLASQRLLALRGKVKFDIDWRELRGKDDEE